MKLYAMCVILLLAFASSAQAANGAHVGLYAPDRYDGIPEMCLMPMDFGYCRAKVKRYYFDIRRMKCTMFYWGGCAGNINNFKSIDECNKLCLDAFEVDREVEAAPAAASVRERQPLTNNNRNSNGNANINNNNNASSSNIKSYKSNSNKDNYDSNGSSNNYDKNY